MHFAKLGYNFLSCSGEETFIKSILYTSILTTSILRDEAFHLENVNSMQGYFVSYLDEISNVALDKSF